MTKLFPVILLLFITACKNAVFKSPSQLKVSTITAGLYNRPDGGDDIPMFEVPRSSHKAILEVLDRAVQDNNPMKWQVLGNIHITHSGGTIKARLFWTDKEVGAFKANDRYYRGGTDQEFIQLISDAKEQAVKLSQGTSKSH